MKKGAVTVILFLLVGVGYANAQPVIMTGMLPNFRVTITSEEPILDKKGIDTGYIKFVSETVTVGGPYSHIDFTFADSTQNEVISIDLYDNSGKDVLVCKNINYIITNKKASLSNSANMVATCDFYPEGFDQHPEIAGIAYMALNGTAYWEKSTDIAASTIKLSGPVGGVIRYDGGTPDTTNHFIFKGTLAATLVRQP